MTATFEPGLFGTGPLPVHLHTGRPTPWSEGCVVRFVPEHGQPWVGNLQKGYGYAKKIVAWREANAFVVIANGTSYLIQPQEPQSWRFLDLLGIDCVVAPSGEIAVLATYSDVVSIDKSGTPLWRRTVAVDGVQIDRIEDGLIYGIAGIDPPDEWQHFVLHLNQGTEAKPCLGGGLT